MAKKSKRQVRREVNTTTEKSAEATTTGRPSGFNPDYQHVIKDLRRVGFLAGSFIVILVALSFFLR